MRLCSIASGSSGNCIYVGDDETHLLVDTGISKKRVEEGLSALGVKGEEIQGILITHEHIDHIQGLGVFSRKYKTPVYGTKGTIEGIRCCNTLGKMPEGCCMRSGWMRYFPSGECRSARLQYPMTPGNRPDTESAIQGRQLRLRRILVNTTITP